MISTILWRALVNWNRRISVARNKSVLASRVSLTEAQSVQNAVKHKFTINLSLLVFTYVKLLTTMIVKQ